MALAKNITEIIHSPYSNDATANLVFTIPAWVNTRTAATDNADATNKVDRLPGDMAFVLSGLVGRAASLPHCPPAAQ